MGLMQRIDENRRNLSSIALGVNSVGLAGFLWLASTDAINTVRPQGKQITNMVYIIPHPHLVKESGYFMSLFWGAFAMGAGVGVQAGYKLRKGYRNH